MRNLSVSDMEGLISYIAMIFMFLLGYLAGFLGGKDWERKKDRLVQGRQFWR